MSILIDFSLAVREDATITFSLTPPAPIGGQNLQFQVMHRFGGVSGIITKTVASGFNNVSGINVTNSGQGIMNISINSADTSGMQSIPRAYNITRLDSGSRTVYTEGYMLLAPSI